jgi:hypothetical protein
VRRSVWDILTNKEAIAVNQAWSGHPGRFVWKGSVGNTHYGIHAKALAGGAQAVLLYNTNSDSNLDVELPMKLLGLDPEKTYTARDVWAKTDLPTAVGNWSVKALFPHDSAFVVFTPV